jgi:hypothetical protein
MPIFGVGLHLAIALFFGIHAVRTGRPMYWLIILFSFPILGSIVYFFAEYLPASKVERGINKAGALVSKALDPGRELREARQAYELSATADNGMRLANALLDAGETAEAAKQFDNCLIGPLAEDKEIRFRAAQAKLLNQEPQRSIDLLKQIRAADEKFRPPEIALVLARAYAQAGVVEEARREFANVMELGASVEAKVEYGIWAIGQQDMATAKQLRADLDLAWKNWPKHARALHKQEIARFDAALAQVVKR